MTTAEPIPASIHPSAGTVLDKIYQTHRTRPKTVATSRLALTELVAGPTSAEALAGVGNAFASDTTFQIKGISGGVATVGFPAAFFADPVPSRLRQAQVVYTLTQFPTVSRVAFEGPPGVARRSSTRADYTDLLPRIIAIKPVIGQRLSSPVTVAGFADVHESTVYVRILDAAGNEIAATSLRYQRWTTSLAGSARSRGPRHDVGPARTGGRPVPHLIR